MLAIEKKHFLDHNRARRNFYARYRSLKLTAQGEASRAQPREAEEDLLMEYQPLLLLTDIVEKMIAGYTEIGNVLHE